MKCKKHPEDDSSSAGVCGSCLRQRLLALVAAQTRAAQLDHFKQHEELSDHRTNFPTSVSPYISRQKFVRGNKDNYHTFPDQKFFSTPQIGPASKIIVEDEDNFQHKRKGIGKLWLFKNLFRSKSAITVTNSDPMVSESRETSTTTTSTTIPSRSWFSSIASKRKQFRACSLDESSINCQTSNRHYNRGRGMSPAICSDEEDDANHSQVATSGFTTEELKQTPRKTPGRNGGGARRRPLSRNVSDIVFCLSPLVRPSPNRIWNQKGGVAAAEMMVSGENRVPATASNSVAAAFCKNRSRKLADFGRCKRTH